MLQSVVPCWGCSGSQNLGFGRFGNPALCRNPHAVLGKWPPNFPLKNPPDGAAWSSEGQLSHCFRLLPAFSSSILAWVSSCEASTWPAFRSPTRMRIHLSAFPALPFFRETLPPLSCLLFLHDQVPLCGISPPGPGRSLVALPCLFSRFSASSFVLWQPEPDRISQVGQFRTGRAMLEFLTFYIVWQSLLPFNSAGQARFSLWQFLYDQA